MREIGTFAKRRLAFLTTLTDVGRSRGCLGKGPQLCGTSSNQF
jgi:hypothetical protein